MQLWTVPFFDTVVQTLQVQSLHCPSAFTALQGHCTCLLLLLRLRAFESCKNRLDLFESRRIPLNSPLSRFFPSIEQAFRLFSRFSKRSRWELVVALVRGQHSVQSDCSLGKMMQYHGISAAARLFLVIETTYLHCLWQQCFVYRLRGTFPIRPTNVNLAPAIMSRMKSCNQASFCPTQMSRTREMMLRLR